MRSLAGRVGLRGLGGARAARTRGRGGQPVPAGTTATGREPGQWASSVRSPKFPPEAFLEGATEGGKEKGGVRMPLHFQLIADGGACRKTPCVPHNRWPEA